jgi:hypothetical protein
MALPAVPEGWTPMEEYLDEVPNPNTGLNFGLPYFVRKSYRTTWAVKNITVFDGSSDACSQQAFALMESQTQ